MKKMTTISLAILVSTLLITVTTISAAESVEIYELAESGVIITFPMTSEEITAKDDEKAILHDTISNKPQNGLQIELAESGEVIEFPAHETEAVAESSDEIIGATAKTDIR